MSCSTEEAFGNGYQLDAKRPQDNHWHGFCFGCGLYEVCWCNAVLTLHLIAAKPPAAHCRCIVQDTLQRPPRRPQQHLGKLQPVPTALQAAEEHRAAPCIRRLGGSGSTGECSMAALAPLCRRR